MRSHQILVLLPMTAALLLGGCSKSADENGSARDAAATATEAAAGVSADAAGEGVPNIAVAPGVAFSYDYAFSLPAKAISGVQQQHAGACQRLGPSRCRITGMNYSQPGEDNVSARMNFLLAPDIAHSFGSDSVATVEKADGKLDQASVNGEDAGCAITLSQQNSAAIQAEVDRIETRLKAKGLGRDERAELTRRAEGLRDQLRNEVQERRAKENSIATTPVSFTYASQSVMGTSGAVGKAAAASWASMATMLSVLMLMLGYITPWLLPILGGVLVWRWRKAKRSLAASSAPANPAATA
jgi:hypothetical protein